MQKERRELQAKLKSQEKKVDYFERAKRLEEIPLLLVALKERQIQDQNFWEQQEKERIQAAIEERNLAVSTRNRFFRMIADKNEFLRKLKNERKQLFEEKLKEFKKLLSEERNKRLSARTDARKEQRRARYLKDKEEAAERKAAEQKRKQEEERQHLEEMARKERERLEKIEKEVQEKKRREHLEMLERAAAMRKAREEEIEKKLQEEKESLRGKPKDESSWRRDVTDRDTVKRDIGSSWRNDDKPTAEEPKKTEVWRRKL